MDVKFYSISSARDLARAWVPSMSGVVASSIRVYPEAFQSILDGHQSVTGVLNNLTEESTPIL